MSKETREDKVYLNVQSNLDFKQKLNLDYLVSVSNGIAEDFW